MRVSPLGAHTDPVGFVTRDEFCDSLTSKANAAGGVVKKRLQECDADVVQRIPPPGIRFSLKHTEKEHMENMGEDLML